MCIHLSKLNKQVEVQSVNCKIKIFNTNFKKHTCNDSSSSIVYSELGVDMSEMLNDKPEGRAQ